MSSPPPQPPPTPLSDFQKIGYNTYLHTPPTYHTTNPAPTPPPLILLFTWNAAAAKHIAKYTLTYQSLFPTSRILLIRCFTQDIFRSSAAYATLLTPAIDLVAEHTGSGGEVLVHSFSNGGGNQVNEFAKAWKKRFGQDGKMPMRVQIMDSSPTKAPWMKSHAAISAGLPRTLFWKWFGGVLVHLLLVCTYLADLVMRRENKMVVLCRQLNDEDVFDRRVPRVYLYSKADQMVGFEEVEAHAEEARAKGWEVDKVVFEKSAHCGHVREDEGRYWKAVLGAWERGRRET
ncbi:hypothetical protein PTNB29_08111 [Pyrenophora teres f. teres]|nr:hypothetical protein PTNB29_08111 [Pyrenophora teres f. teres]